MLILLHTSKTMHKLGPDYGSAYVPTLLPQAEELASYLAGLPAQSLADVMKIKLPLAEKVSNTMRVWHTETPSQRSAIYSFAGDIYSGLQVHTWSPTDLDYAQQHLRILSGLYGVLRPLDGIMPYRLELGYRLPDAHYKNLYSYWGDAPAKTLPKDNLLVNLAAKEYSDLVLKHLNDQTVITPKFLTISPKTGEPTFVVVHAKIARGAFAAWLIKHQITNIDDLARFDDLGYEYSVDLSSDIEPTFICKQFGGLGLSVRLQHTRQ